MEAYQDYDLWLRLSLKYPVEFMDTPLIRYHVHSGMRITTNYKRKIMGIERISLKYASYFSKDSEASYWRCNRLLPNYLKLYGRKKAFELWIFSIKSCPWKIVNNSKRLIMIAMGIDLYKSTRAMIFSFKHILKRDRHLRTPVSSCGAQL